jgi:hypothetical protein
MLTTVPAPVLCAAVQALRAWDGPKVGSVTLSPRGDWRMPSDAVVSVVG